jgi:6-pyruvoyltetrahydropterin/6-carboxytetrahydropterin synthase
VFELKVVTDFSAAHQLKEFQGPCEDLHGHNWKVEVFVTSETLDETGVVIDFRILKKHVKAVVSTLDHKFLNKLDPFTTQNPSSENIARYLAEELDRLLEGQRVRVSRVTAWESESACATYYP